MTVEASLDVVIAVHQHFWLDDRHDLRLLTQRGVARQRVHIGLMQVLARDAIGPMSITARHFANRAPCS